MESPTSPSAVIAAAVEERIAKRGNSDKQEEKYISASSLAHGCMQFVAREILGFPKPPLEPRVRRILDVGIEGHRRIERYLRGVSLAREVFFQDDEYRIKGYCDDLIYIPPELSEEHSGFYALEIKTAGSTIFERLVDEGCPREDHARQCMIYIWGLARYYRGHIPIKGGVVFYENRDTLEHHLFDVAYDEAQMSNLLTQVEAMWERLKEGQLPDDHLSLDHWYHRYCPYLDICGVGQGALKYQKEHRQPLPDKVLAGIIGKRIMRKQRREGAQAERSKGPCSLEELATQLNWK